MSTVAALVILAACSSGGYTAGPTPAPGPTTTTTTTTTVAAEVTVRGVVAQALASARVVILAQPVSGFGTIALTQETDVVRPDGAKAAINDIVPGANVEVTGRPSTPDTLLARRLVLL